MLLCLAQAPPFFPLLNAMAIVLMPHGRVWTWEELRQYPYASPGQMNKQLKAFRQRMSGPWDEATRTWCVGTERCDFTMDQAINWQGWLAGHPQGQKVVGDGVLSIEAMFVNSFDPDQRQARLDFVVTTLNGDDVRLHPHSTVLNRKSKDPKRPPTKEATPVYGNKEEWLMSGGGSHPAEDAVASSSDAALPVYGTEVGRTVETEAADDGVQPPGTLLAAAGQRRGYARLSARDSVGRGNAWTYLSDYLERWDQRAHPRGAFYWDLTNEAVFDEQGSPACLDWRGFLAGQWVRQTAVTGPAAGGDLTTGAGITNAGVCSFAICWLESTQHHDIRGPGFHVVVANARRDPRAAPLPPVNIAINPSGGFIRAALTPGELGVVDDR